MSDNLVPHPLKSAQCKDPFEVGAIGDRVKRIPLIVIETADSKGPRREFWTDDGLFMGYYREP